MPGDHGEKRKNGRSVMRLFAVLSVMVLCACGLTGEVVTATPDEITISVSRAGQGNAGKKAREHCAKYGKQASLVSTGDGIMAFRCVAVE